MLAVHAGKLDLLLDQVMRAIRTYRRYHAVERFEPLGGFLGIVVFGIGDIFQNFVGYSGHARLLI